MDQNEKAQNGKFWTLDMILLVILNIVLIVGIIFSLLLIYMNFSVPVTAWLSRIFGL